MIESLITNKTRLKLLLKFFLNKQNSGYLRNLESEFGESSNAIRVELNRLEAAGLLSSNFKGNKKIFRANDQHPLYDEINSILRKTVGLDKIVANITSNIGNLSEVYLIGDLAEGKDAKLIDMLLVGETIDNQYLARLTTQMEKLISRRMRFLILNDKEKQTFILENTSLLLWQSGNNQVLQKRK